MNQTSLTVVMCTFNRARPAARALESLVALRSDNRFGFDIVVVDDGSSDDTANLLGAIKQRSAVEITYIYQENRGVGSARNAGVRAARGQWVAFFDDDQLADPEWLLNLYLSAEASGADCLGGPALLMLPPDEKIALTPEIRWLLGESLLMAGQKNRRFGLDPLRNVVIPGTGNAFVRKSLFDAIGLFPDGVRMGEDREFFMRALKNGAKFGIAPRAVVYQVVPKERLTHSYLMNLAAKMGSCSGEIDTRTRGIFFALYVAIMRSLRLLLITLPGLIIAWAGRRSGERYSARHSASYIVAVVRSVAKRLTQRQRSSANSKQTVEY